MRPAAEGLDRRRNAPGMRQHAHPLYDAPIPPPMGAVPAVSPHIPILIPIVFQPRLPAMTRLVSFRLAATLAGTAALACCAAGSAFAADATGTWLTEDGRGRIRTEHCGPGKADLCGYVVWMKEPMDEKGKPRLDESNPDAKKKARPVLGHELMTALKPADEGRYEGKVYNADNGKSYDVKVWSEEPAELSVKGCLFSYLCKTQSWKRVSDVVPGQLVGATDGAGGPRSDR